MSTTATLSLKETTSLDLVQRLVGTDASLSPLVLRAFLGAVMLPHGAQKLLGWFGGYGFSGTMGYFTDVVGLPWLIAFLVILIESFGALMLIAGVGTRLAALGTAAVMVGAIATAHWQHGFFMNWFGAQQGEGIEFHLLAIALAVGLVITGGGRWSVDRALSRT